eukprot:11811334-Karenia_brevis.AAC.1
MAKTGATGQQVWEYLLSLRAIVDEATKVSLTEELEPLKIHQGWVAESSKVLLPAVLDPKDVIC